MKITIVIQSQDFANSAGMRIRYNRLLEVADKSQYEINFQTLQDLCDRPSDLDGDVYIFCKTFSANAILMAHWIRRKGKVVGQDLFDDYFSQNGDPRLARFRDWLSQMVPVTDFVVCSTPNLAKILTEYYPRTPITVMDDPAIVHDAAAIAKRADTKMWAAKSGNYDVLWFGIGDNPYFSVGIDDLAACAGHIAELQKDGSNPRLILATNARALDANGLAMLRRTVGHFDIVEWTEAEEARLLDEACVAVLPVNGQSFSRAKSLNRAITALVGGCQVLSLGYPLYAPLDELIYRSAADVAVDIAEGKGRLSAGMAERFEELLRTHASLSIAAERFFGAVRQAVEARGTSPGSLLFCLHGRQSSFLNHKLGARMGAISARTPFSRDKWNFPLRFDIVDNRLEMLVSKPLLKDKRFAALPFKFGSRAVGDVEYQTLDRAAAGLPLLPVYADPEQPMGALMDYRPVLSQIISMCRLVDRQAQFVLCDDATAYPGEVGKLSEAA